MMNIIYTYLKTFFVFLIFIFPILSYSQDQVTLSGYLKDAENGETLIGATVYLQEIGNGASTNEYGFYSITIASGEYTAEFSYLGYETVVQKIKLDADQKIDLELETEKVELVEVVVTSEVEDANVSDIEMSTVKMDIKAISKIPAFLGEVDVIKSIQTLPGVSSVGEGASGFNVRGGSVGQNLVLLDEAPVYNSSHLLGFFSVFNPDAVKDIKLIKGGVPARYGGRIASILDIRMKEGNSKKFSARGGVGTIFSRLAIEAPIVKDKASFIVAGRRSYIDLLARPFTDVLSDGAALNFWDLTLKTNYKINDKNRLYLSGYLGRDVFKFDARQGFSWGNQTVTARWNHLFSNKLFAIFTFFYSNYDYELAFGDNDLDKFDWNSKIRNLALKPEFTYYLNPNNTLTFGGEVIRYDFEPANAVGVSNGESTNISTPGKQALESSIYVDNKQKIHSKIDVQYGLRLSNFRLLGSANKYEFDTTVPAGDRQPVTNITSFGSWKTIQSYTNLEPRLSIKYQLNKSSSIKASYNRMVQNIHLISNTTASNPLDIWTPSTNNIKPELGDQVALGYFRNFGKENDYESSVELYYRNTQNQIDYIDGSDILINEFLEGELLSGSGRAYGMEFFVKKNSGKVNGYISYTLARTELKIDGINNAEWYPTRFDQTHNLKLSVFYEPTERWDFSANFSYISGTPTTFPNSRYEVQGYVIPYITDNARNNVRIPSFHRLDLAATLHGKKQKRNGKMRKNEDYWVFSFYNVYNRRNPFSIYFAQDNEIPDNANALPTSATRVSIIGSIIPAISYNFKF